MTRVHACRGRRKDAGGLETTAAGSSVKSTPVSRADVGDSWNGPRTIQASLPEIVNLPNADTVLTNQSAKCIPLLRGLVSPAGGPLGPIFSVFSRCLNRFWVNSAVFRHSHGFSCTDEDASTVPDRKKTRLRFVGGRPPDRKMWRRLSILKQKRCATFASRVPV